MTRFDHQTLRKQLRKQGLNPDTIELHQRRIANALHTGSKPEFSVVDTCRINNYGILPANWLTHISDDRNTSSACAAFVPAAGAASRYLDGLSNDETAALLGNMQPPAQTTAAHYPKAFFPCVPGGPSFLVMKTLEHEAMGCISEQYFVAPEGQSKAFQDYSDGSRLKTKIIEQGLDLSTIRFDVNAQPVIDQSGAVSIVPAGHGMLIEFFPTIRATNPQIESLFIRNIDNVIGTHPHVIAASQTFVSTHQKLTRYMRLIRDRLPGNESAAGEIAQILLGSLPQQQDTAAVEAFLQKCPPSQHALWRLQFGLFGLTTTALASVWPDAPSTKALQRLYERPVNILGQVPNSGKDVGGTPAWVRTPQGEVRVCLELPHASLADQERFICNPERATHFNPVFVVAEIATNLSAYKDNKDLFWVMAHKKFAGQDVYYHETILFELLGNSILANSVFIEIPRFLFNPHKSHRDTLGRDVSHWLPSKH